MVAESGYLQMAENQSVMPSTFESGDFGEWLEHFEICAMANGWTVEQKSLKLATRLQGEALIAYKDIPMDDRKNYEIVKAALQRALIPEEGKFIAMDTFHKLVIISQ